MDHRFVRRDLVMVRDLVLVMERDLVCDELLGTALSKLGLGLLEPSPTTALRTQTTDGSPSSIFCQLLPSSCDPNRCPLRVPK
jgi:hypothetical protein